MSKTTPDWEEVSFNVMLGLVLIVIITGVVLMELYGSKQPCAALEGRIQISTNK